VKACHPPKNNVNAFFSGIADSSSTNAVSFHPRAQRTADVVAMRVGKSAGH
jgi:hypothetical protein